MSVVPSISILTPVWNGLPYLKETVESVLAQDYQDWEMIIADNASTDGTTEYLQSLTDPRIKVYRHETNIGLYRNNHFLFTKARAPIYVGLCADDYFYPGALRKVVNEWKVVGPEVNLITFNWKTRQMNHNKLSKLCYAVLPNQIEGVEAMFAFFLFGCFPGNFSEISAKVAVVAPEQYLYHIKFSADYEYWLRLSKKNRFYLSNTDGVVYIRRHDRVASTYTITKGEYLEESIQVYENIVNDLSKYCSRRKLIAFYNIDIVSFHLRIALKAATKGKFEALKSFMKLKSPIFWPKGIQFLACLPFALSETLRYSFSVKLAKEIFKSANNKIPHV